MNEDRIVHKKHFHIDNGGYTISVDCYGATKIHFGFFGYADTTIVMRADDGFGPVELAEFFATAEANRIQYMKKHPELD